MWILLLSLDRTGFSVSPGFVRTTFSGEFHVCPMSHAAFRKRRKHFRGRALEGRPTPPVSQQHISIPFH